MTLFVQVGSGAQVVGEARVHRHQLVRVVTQGVGLVPHRHLGGAIAEPAPQRENALGAVLGSDSAIERESKA